MKPASFCLALLSLSAMSAAAAGTWTTTPVNDIPPVLVSAADGNLARFGRTQVAATANGGSNVRWLVNGMHEEKDGGQVIYQMKTGANAVFTFAAEARLDEVRFHTFWDSGRNDFGFASIDVCDANGDWTTLDNSSLAKSNVNAKGNTYVFADANGDPLATGVTAVRIVLGDVENGWGGVSEIEVLGAFLGTRTVTFCDADGDPLPGVATQTVSTGTAATEPDPSLVPQRNGSLLFAGWDTDVYAVFEDIRPRPVYNSVGVQYSRNAAWTDTPLAQATAALTSEGNLARLPTTTLPNTAATAISNPSAVTNGVFDYGSTVLYDHKTVMFDLGAEADIVEVRVFVSWKDNGRSDAGILALRARDAAGAWTTLEGSLLPYEVSDSSVVGHRLSFADPTGVPFARRVTALEIEFGTMENGYVGLPEIEIFGEFYVPSSNVLLILVN